MKKIAIVVQQYGPELYSGAELHCMRLAEKLALFYKVEVLTTCSIDFLTWANYYPAGETEINQVTVRRFEVSQLRDWGKMGQLEEKVRTDRNEFAQKSGIGSFFKKLISKRNKKKATEEDYLSWVMAQGPTTPDLIDYLKTNEQNYDGLIFFTYLYYPTVFGMGINPHKTIFIPLAHDEWAIYMPVYKKMFKTPACIMYNSMAEKRLVNRLFENETVYSDIAGIWVELPAAIPAFDVKLEMNIITDYILYIGRIDDFKITESDFEWFLRYKLETKKSIKLVLAGNLQRQLPVSDHILYLGFVNEQVKFNLIKQSMFVFQPSQFESLSMVVLEAFAMERPVLVHRNCEVMKDHIDQSHGGFYYNDYESFKRALDQLTGDVSLNLTMGISGKAYVDNTYSSEMIISKFQHAIEYRICKES